MQNPTEAPYRADPVDTPTDTPNPDFSLRGFEDDTPLEGFPAEEEASTGAASTFNKQVRNTVIEIIETVALAAVIWLVLNTATARYVVEGVSMQPNLETGQYFIVSRMAYWFSEPERGDVIVFHYPNNPEDDYVKRIVGLPGETVAINELGEVTINGEVLAEPYIEPPRSVFERSWEVPEGSYFVMGDNRGSSSDSRSWGPLEESFIIGKAWLSYWPFETWGVAPHFDYED